MFSVDMGWLLASLVFAMRLTGGGAGGVGESRRAAADRTGQEDVQWNSRVTESYPRAGVQKWPSDG